MLLASRTRRAVLRGRASQNRMIASLKRGRSITTHVLAAGIDPETAEGVANALRSVAKRLGVQPVKVTRAHRTVKGKESRTKVSNHYTAAQVAFLASQYSPRKLAFKQAKLALAA